MSEFQRQASLLVKGSKPEVARAVLLKLIAEVHNGDAVVMGARISELICDAVEESLEGRPPGGGVPRVSPGVDRHL